MPIRNANGGASRRCLALAVLMLAVAGCRTSGSRPVARPVRHSVHAERFTVLTDFKLPEDHPLIADLAELRGEVTRTLDLPEARRKVAVYIFSDELQYRQYLDATFPGLPSRRAYFVGTPSELAVYTFWGERIREDLRHEFTHGLLHSGLQDVPLWLDEGLAEYFEVADGGRLNTGYARRLSRALANGWEPDLRRLEGIEQFSQMQRLDYQEAWAWVHFLIHDGPRTRETLIAYLHELRTDGDPGRLSDRLDTDMADLRSRFLSHLASLEEPGQNVGAAHL